LRAFFKLININQQSSINSNTLVHTTRSGIEAFVLYSVVFNNNTFIRQ